MDVEFVVETLQALYWAKDEPKARLRAAITGSHPYGLYAPDGAPAGFVRVLSDGVYNARISDLFVLPEHRGRGLARWIISRLLYASRFCDVRAWQLATDDAHGLYERFGFNTFKGDGRFMTLVRDGG